MPRFVVLHHVMPPDSDRPTHWDFMLEEDDSLSTWALERAPRAHASIACRSLSQHRKHYLEYEGPVSDDRGSVRAWDRGTFRWSSRRAGTLTVDVAGKKLNGTVTLTRRDRNWLFRYAPSDQSN